MRSEIIDSGKKKIFDILVLCIFLGCIFVTYVIGVNKDKSFDNRPIFSVTSGFYDTEFELEITCRNASKIYYTLDGSIPTTDSFEYSVPIHIGDASESENVWSMISDVSMLYNPPTVKLDKCTVVRAIAVSKLGGVSDIVSATYFVGFADKQGYENTNFISVMTDADNLFHPETGIYVLGEEYQNYKSQLESGLIDKVSSFEWTPANYRNKGKDWEREVVVQFFDAKGEMTVGKTSGLRIQGNVSRGYYPRSFNLYARKEYDGTEKFDYSFFGDNYRATRLTLSAGGNDYKKNIKEYFIDQLIGDELNVATMKFEPYSLFLNGEYWGCYWLETKYDECFFKYYYGVDAKDVVMIKNGDIEIGTESDIILYEDMMDFAVSNDMSVEDNYRKICDIIDIDSMIDYYAMECYLARRGDWPRSNVGLWCTRKKGSGYADGKWRFVVFDMNSNCLTKPEHDTLNYILNRDSLFASLWQNLEFKKEFSKRMMDLYMGTFSAERAQECGKEIETLYNSSHKKSYERFREWPEDKSFNLTDKYIEFFEQRGKYIIDIFSFEGCEQGE